MGEQTETLSYESSPGGPRFFGAMAARIFGFGTIPVVIAAVVLALLTIADPITAAASFITMMIFGELVLLIIVTLVYVVRRLDR